MAYCRRYLRIQNIDKNCHSKEINNDETVQNQ